MNRLPDRRVWLGSGVVGLVVLLVLVVAGLSNPAGFFQAYLFGYSLWLGLGLGCLGIALIQFLTGGAWGLATRRIFEAGAATVPAMAVLFVPLLFGLPALYPWARPDQVSADAVLQHRAPYMNTPFFIARAVVYLVCWVVLVILLRRLSVLHDRADEPLALRRLQRLSVIGAMVLGVTVSFAAIDWLMALDGDWYSTMYPPLVAMADLLLALAVAILVVIWLAPSTMLGEIMSPQLLNDLGSLLLAFLMLFTYLSYFQYMLIWSGNLSDEIPWYLSRTDGGWRPLALFLVFVGFFVPFGLLLFRPLKRRPGTLAGIAALMVVIQLVHHYWLIAPPFEPNGPAPSWLDVLAVVGFGGVWLALFSWQLAARPLLPAYDPRLEQVREVAHAGA